MIDRLLITLLLLAAIATVIGAGRLLIALRKQRVLKQEQEWIWTEAGREDVPPAEGADRVLFFTTPDCVQCREQQAPALERLRNKWPKPLIVERIDALERRDLAERYGILTVPSTVVFAAGEPRAVNYGYTSAEKLARQLDGESYAI